MSAWGATDPFHRQTLATAFRRGSRAGRVVRCWSGASVLVVRLAKGHAVRWHRPGPHKVTGRPLRTPLDRLDAVASVREKPAPCRVRGLRLCRFEAVEAVQDVGVVAFVASAKNQVVTVLDVTGQEKRFHRVSPSCLSGCCLVRHREQTPARRPVGRFGSPCGVMGGVRDPHPVRAKEVLTDQDLVPAGDLLAAARDVVEVDADREDRVGERLDDADAGVEVVAVSGLLPHPEGEAVLVDLGGEPRGDEGLAEAPVGVGGGVCRGHRVSPSCLAAGPFPVRTNKKSTRSRSCQVPRDGEARGGGEARQKKNARARARSSTRRGEKEARREALTRRGEAWSRPWSSLLAFCASFCLGSSRRREEKEKRTKRGTAAPRRPPSETNPTEARRTRQRHDHHTGRRRQSRRKARHTRQKEHGTRRQEGTRNPAEGKRRGAARKERKERARKKPEQPPPPKERGTTAIRWDPKS